MSDNKFDKITPEQHRAEIAIERDKLKNEQLETELDVAYGNNVIAEDTKRNTSDLQDEWEYLRSIARAEFPEGRFVAGLSPNNRLVAIAHCLGWTTNRIHKASGLARRTIDKYLVRPDVKLFMKEFNMRRGADGQDVMTKFTELEYKGVKCVERILDDLSDDIAVKRLQLDANKWVFERNRGKPDQKIEMRGSLIKQFMGKLSEASKDFKIDETEESEIFETDEKLTH